VVRPPANDAPERGADSDEDDLMPIPENINASRRDSDNAIRQNGGQAGVEGFNKNLVSFRVDGYLQIHIL
jgi:hypothetical protein